MDEKDKEIEKLKKELKFANDQLSKTLKLYDSAKEETRKAVAARSELLSKLSHEAKTPMNALMGYSQLIRTEDVSGEYFDYAMGIKSSTNRLLNFFDDLIELSRIESGLSTLITDEYETADSIKYVVNNVRYEIESKGLELRLKIGENMPIVLCGDKTHIHQIVLNLLNNAIKFTENGYISIEIDGEMTDEISENGRKIIKVSVSVEDTGKGIKKGDREKLFKAFSQFNSSSPYANQGAGLGLIIAKHFCNLMNGDITFDSHYGKGSRFTCTFRQEVVDERVLDVKFVEDYVYNSDMKLSAPQAKVLLVDDSRVNLSVAAGLLKWFDIEAITAGGGREAVEMASKEHFDIVFMDHMMPDMDGVEATKHIRALDEHNKNMAIIALTANTTDEARIMFRENGFNDFLAKPVEIDNFKSMLERWLPRERVVRNLKAVENKDEKEKNTGIDNELFAQKGILVDKGLVYFAGSMDAYVDTLKLICKEGQENVDKLKVYFSNKDLHNYGIIAHSIKSVMASIGANDLSEYAKTNELEAKAQNESYILNNGEDFIQQYKNMIEFISENIPNNEKTATKSAGTALVDSESFESLIDEAIADIEDFESDAAIDKLNMLKESLKKM